MFRWPCLMLCLGLSLPACADVDKPLFQFESQPPVVDLSLSGHEETEAGPAVFANHVAEPAKMSREQRRAARDRLLEKLGLARFIPARSFSAFGHDARLSLSMQDEDSVTLRMRIKW